MYDLPEQSAKIYTAASKKSMKTCERQRALKTTGLKPGEEFLFRLGPFVKLRDCSAMKDFRLTIALPSKVFVFAKKTF